MAYRLQEYADLLTALRAAGYRLAPVIDYFAGPRPASVHLRHDVDRMVARAVAMARGEHALQVRATYYFRCGARGEFPRAAIESVRSLGHEIGFHYECLVRERGDLQRAAQRFERELAALRKLADVQTIAAHGSPLSSHSNMRSADGLDLVRLGLRGDASVHLDFQRVLYITDTGGAFGSPHNRRDRVRGRNWVGPTSPGALGERLAAQREDFVLLSTHPERWPASAAGLVQAQLTDLLANLAKRLAAGPSSGRGGAGDAPAERA